MTAAFRSFPRCIARAGGITRGGLRFSRRADGAVVVLHGTIELAIIPANEWASVVSDLTPEGESTLSYTMALALHTGMAAYDPEAYRHETDLSPNAA